MCVHCNSNTMCSEKYIKSDMALLLGFCLGGEGGGARKPWCLYYTSFVYFFMNI